MALIVGIPYQALDGNGEVMPFAEYHTFEADAPTTPKTTYADPGLTVEHPNPLPALDDGYFPPMYAQEGDALYVALTPQNGDPDVPFKAYEQVWALGSDETTAFDRIFSDARLSISSGEVEPGLDGVIIQAGYSSPQNVGGAIKESGWNGTQLDKKITDAAETQLTGSLEVNGPIRSPDPIGLVVPMVVSRGVASAVATLDMALPDTYPSYILEIRNFVGSLATAQNLLARLSFDNAATFKSAADDYQNNNFYNNNTIHADAAINGTSMTVIIGNGGGLGLGGTDAKIQLWTGAGRETRIHSSFVGFTAGSTALSAIGVVGSTTNNKSYGRATNLRITPSTGTMSFSWVLIGQP